VLMPARSADNYSAGAESRALNVIPLYSCVHHMIANCGAVRTSSCLRPVRRTVSA